MSLRSPHQRGRRRDPRLELARSAKATLRHVRFSSGIRLGMVQLSPHLTGGQRRTVESWIRKMPEAFHSRLPAIKLAVAEKLSSVRRGIFINETPPSKHGAAKEHTHAISLVPECYVVLEANLFQRRIELGRILYHELCHFVWPRLGNPRRRQFKALLQLELRDRVSGELGYSSEYRKASLLDRKGHASRQWLLRRKLDYFCESFCDTGSFVLLGNQRRSRHSEYTLSAAARRRRCHAWSEIVLGTPCDRAVSFQRSAISRGVGKEVATAPVPASRGRFWCRGFFGAWMNPERPAKRDKEHPRRAGTGAVATS